MDNKTVSAGAYALLALLVVSGVVAAQGSGKPPEHAASYWTAERRAAAIPRDFVIDSRGLAYIRGKSGQLIPHGHTVAALAPARGKPSGNDSNPPAVTNLSPADGATVGTTQTFSASITDNGTNDTGVKSVSFVIETPSGTTQSFNATASGDSYSVTLSFTGGIGQTWNWWVVAKDNGPKGGNTTQTDPYAFMVSDGGGSGVTDPTPDEGTVTNARWTKGGTIQTAAGRIYFEMPNNFRLRRWSGYVCSGTVVNDGSDNGRSVILTAAHCVYDDANKAFARNVLFIPDQANTNGAGTDLNCSNDPIGCWEPALGVVDVNWTTGVFPNNIPYDYAYYVVPDSDAHTPGLNSANDALDMAASAMDISFDPSDSEIATAGLPTLAVATHALGYSYSEDPNFMYCAEGLETEGAYNDWWLPHCGLSGGSSGGSWTQSQTDDLGTGPVMSVNSWGYTDQPGMAGPPLHGNDAACLFTRAKSEPLPSQPMADGAAGVIGCQSQP